MSLGLYLHIPYCRSICPYCDFNAHVEKSPPWQALTDAMCAQMQAHAQLFSGPLVSIYFGGGTPSLMPPQYLVALIKQAQQVFGIQAEAEITLEANPGRIESPVFESLFAAGINRISMGWQSTHNHLLRLLGRGHSAEQSDAAYRMARAAGFKNISLDLIFAVPGQTLADLAADLERVIDLRPEHVSLYALTYKPNTPFERRRNEGRLIPVDEAVELHMMQQIEKTLQAADYTHYEISNYARPNKRAVHNSLYWQGQPYLGIGPGAHSFCHHAWQKGWRWESIRDPKMYIDTWQGLSKHTYRHPDDIAEAHVSFCETLSSSQLFAEFMLCGFRQRDGILLKSPICKRHPHALATGLRQAKKHGWVHLEDGFARPTALGFEHADALGSLFF